MTVGSAMAPDSHDQFHREEKNQWAFVGTWVLVPVQVFWFSPAEFNDRKGLNLNLGIRYFILSSKASFVGG